MKKWFVILITLLFLGGVGYDLMIREQVSKLPEHPIVIVFENDVHCAVDGYAKLVALREQQRAETPYITTVSSGDFVQGGVVGSLSKGENVITIMNEVKYDVVTLGNHEFDYGISQLFKLRDSLNATVVSANFYDLRASQLAFPPYRIIRYGEVDIAFMGLTTSTTGTLVASRTFLDEGGRIVYNFSRPTFYENAQYYINQARAEGADYVVVLSHLGDMDRGEHASSVSLITRTTGIDVVLDGHEHRAISDSLVLNLDGEPVLLASTGTKFLNVGLLTLSTDGNFTARLVSSDDIEASEEIQTFVETIKEKTLKEGERVIGTNSQLLSPDDAFGNRLVRHRETNIGNFCADAFRVVLDVDVALINGGGIRANLHEGKITYNHLLSVFPFNNQSCTATMTGQQLADALEFSVSYLPEEDGSFMQVSGVKFEVDASVPSPIVKDRFQMFSEVGKGERRVCNVKVLDKNSGKYRPLDLAQEYTIASFDYQIKNLGCAGIFRYATLKEDKLPQDVEVLAFYIQQVLGGRIGSQYGQTEGRIRIK